MALMLDLDIRRTEDGRRVLHFPFMTISDIHWGTKYTRAKRLCQLLENTTCDKLTLVGDIIDGYALLRKNEWNFPTWHSQGMAHVLRKTTQGTETAYISGNHEEEIRGKNLGHHDGQALHHRKLSGKTLYGIKFADEMDYKDPKNRTFLLIHGDQYDGKVSNFYAIGDMAYTALYEIDGAVHKLAPIFARHALTRPLVPMIESFTFAAWCKRVTKSVINTLISARKNMSLALDLTDHDGIIYGHSHMAGIHKTAFGKMMINDGCCTEHVQSLVHDKHGNFGIITWHKDRMDVEMEDGHRYVVNWKDIGLNDDFNRTPTEYNDIHNEKTNRLLRLIYRQWPSKEHQARRDEIRENRSLVKEFNAAVAKGRTPTTQETLHFTQAVISLEIQQQEALKLPIPRRTVSSTAAPTP